MGLFKKLFGGRNDSRSASAVDTGCRYDEIDDEEFDEIDDGEALDVYEAADIWRSYGEDEDCMFGFTEEELRKAL